MGRVRVERISLRDERSHSEGISLSRANGQCARARAHGALGKIPLTLTKICFAARGSARERKKKEKRRKENGKKKKKRERERERERVRRERRAPSIRAI